MEVSANTAPAVDAGTVAPVTTTTDSGEPLSVRDAAALVHKRREEENKPAPNRAPDGKFAAQESAQAEGDAPAPEQPSVETDPVEVDPAETPSIDPPRSWTKEEKEAFKALPPEHQQRIADRERVRELEIRRGQNEAAETRKAAEAERLAANQEKQRYASAINQTLTVLVAQQNAEFADIKTPADVQKLANEDPFRFVQWQARREQINTLQQQQQQIAQQRRQEALQLFDKWAKDEDTKFSEQAKEFADPKKVAEARKEVVSYLTDVRGIPQDRLTKLWNGQEPLYIRSAEAQLIIRDAAKWHAAQQRASAAAKAPVPPVQRPGTAPSKGDAQSASIQALSQKLDAAKSPMEQIRAAAALRAAKRAAK